MAKAVRIRPLINWAYIDKLGQYEPTRPLNSEIVINDVKLGQYQSPSELIKLLLIKKFRTGPVSGPRTTVPDALHGSAIPRAVALGLVHRAEG